ncbi:hypothetical protein HK096_006290, partial [Nowakowskiella sp. JEL0078]
MQKSNILSLSDSLLDRIFNYISPLEKYSEGGLAKVCQRFQRVVLLSSRTVLLTLTLTTMKHDDSSIQLVEPSAAFTSSNSENIKQLKPQPIHQGKSHLSFSNLRPAENYTPIMTSDVLYTTSTPVNVPPVVQACSIVEAFVPLSEFPSDTNSILTLLENLMNTLVLLEKAHTPSNLLSIARGPSDLKKSLMLIPWEIRVSPRLWNESAARKLRTVLLALRSRIISIAYPPPTIFKLLSPFTRVVRLTYVGDGLDLAGIERLGELARLDMDGPPGFVRWDDFEPEDIESGDLKPLVNVKKSLVDLRIGPFFPLVDFTGFCETLKELSLKHLFIRGIWQGEKQGDQSQELLANMVASWPLIQDIHYLGDVGRGFWDLLNQKLQNGEGGLSNLRYLTVELSAEKPDIDAVYAVGDFLMKHTPPVKVIRFIFDNLEDTPDQTITFESIMKFMEYFKDKSSINVLLLFAGVNVKLTELGE